MKKTITLVTIILAIIFYSFTVKAQDIKYHDVSPDTTISTWEVFGFYGIDIWWHPSPEVVINAWAGYEILCGTDSMPKALNAGDDISASGAGLWIQTNYQCLNCGGAMGNWKGVTNKYLGWRKKGASSGQYYYGWARLDVPANAGSFTIKEYALHNIANTAIKGGQIYATGISYTAVAQDIVPVLQNKVLSFKGLKQNAEVSVINVSGDRLIHTVINAGGNIDLSSYPKGVYVLQVATMGTKGCYKISL